MMLMERAQKRKLIEIKSKVAKTDLEDCTDLVVQDLEDEIRKASKKVRNMQKKVIKNEQRDKLK